MEPQIYDSSSDAVDEEFWEFAESSSDEKLDQLIIAVEEQQENGRNRHLGSVPGRTFTERYRGQFHHNLYRDFSENPVHNEVKFRRRFRMHRPLFLRILHGVEGHDSYFVQKKDSTGRLGFSSLQKTTGAMRMLAYGYSADSVADYVRMGESTAIETLRRLVQAIIDVFGAEYLQGNL